MVFGIVIFFLTVIECADANESSHMQSGYYLLSQHGYWDRRMDEDPGDKNSSHTASLANYLCDLVQVI